MSWWTVKHLPRFFFFFLGVEMIYALRRGENILSLHLTLTGARAALKRYQQSDKTGEVAYIDSVDNKEPAFAVITVLCMVVMGILLAWRG